MSTDLIAVSVRRLYIAGDFAPGIPDGLPTCIAGLAHVCNLSIIWLFRLYQSGLAAYLVPFVDRDKIYPMWQLLINRLRRT